MKYSIYLLMAMLLLATALADIDVVFDRTISHETTIDLNGTSFVVLISEVNNSPIRLVSETESLQVEEGDCITRLYSKFCYIDYDEDQRIDANLTDARPIIDVDRDISSRNLDLGETSSIVLTLENTGGEIVNDFFFVETIPIGLTIVNASGCSINDDDNRRIEWDEDLYPDEPVYCNYTLQAASEGVFTYEGSYTTNKLVSSQDGDAIPQVSITNSNFFDLNISVSNSDLSMGQPFVLSFSLENLESSNGDNLSIQGITVKFNDEFSLIQEYNSPFTTVSLPDEFRFSGKIEPEELFEQRIELVPIVARDNLSLELEIAYQLGTDAAVNYTRFLELNQTFFPLECEYLIVDDAGNNLISLEKLNNTLPGFDRGEMFVYIYNENPYVDIQSIRYVASGDLDFPDVGKTTSLRRGDSDVLISKLFTFDSTSVLDLNSRVDLDYTVLDSFYEASCVGDVYVEEPKFLAIEKSLSFVNVTREGVQRSVPRVVVEVENEFFLPLRNIQIAENLPSQIFSNNNTQKSFTLAPFEIHTFTYDFFIPNDYASLAGDEIQVDSLISYTVYESDFSENISLTFNSNDVLSAQEGVILTDLIDTKVEALREEINKSFIESLPQENQTNISSEPITTYSPLLNYFTLAIIIFLFLMALVILNLKYSVVHRVRVWHEKRKAKAKVKKEAAFAARFQSYLEQEDEVKKMILQKKKSVAQSQKEVQKEEKKYKKKAATLHAKKNVSQQKISVKEKEMRRLELQKKNVEEQLALLHRSLVAYQNESQSLDVQKTKEKTILDMKIASLQKQKHELVELESKMDLLEKSVQTMKATEMKSAEKEEKNRKLLKGTNDTFKREKK